MPFNTQAAGVVALDAQNEPLATADSWRGRRPSDEIHVLAGASRGQGATPPTIHEAQGQAATHVCCSNSTGRMRATLL